MSACSVAETPKIWKNNILASLRENPNELSDAHHASRILKHLAFSWQAVYFTQNRQWSSPVPAQLSDLIWGGFLSPNIGARFWISLSVMSALRLLAFIIIRTDRLKTNPEAGERTKQEWKGTSFSLRFTFGAYPITACNNLVYELRVFIPPNLNM